MKQNRKSEYLAEGNIEIIERVQMKPMKVQTFPSCVRRVFAFAFNIGNQPSALLCSVLHIYALHTLNTFVLFAFNVCIVGCSLNINTTPLMRSSGCNVMLASLPPFRGRFAIIMKPRRR